MPQTATKLDNRTDDSDVSRAAEVDGSGVDRVDKSAASVREMFGAVAPRYDLLNRVLSGRQDIAWRRRAGRSLAAAPGSRVLDLCCGTGDLALEIRARGARVVAADFCIPMLALAEQKYRSVSGPTPLGVAGDAMELPLPTASFDGATVAFGLRNVADLDVSLKEIARVLRPGARVAILEFGVPENQLVRAGYLFYFRRVLPRIGRLVSDRGSAYTYLPQSVLDFPQRLAFAERLEAAGFTNVGWKDLSAGITILYEGVRTE